MCLLASLVISAVESISAASGRLPAFWPCGTHSCFSSLPCSYWGFRMQMMTLLKSTVQTWRRRSQKQTTPRWGSASSRLPRVPPEKEREPRVPRVGLWAPGLAFCISTSKQDVWLPASKLIWNTFLMTTQYLGWALLRSDLNFTPVSVGLYGVVSVAFASLNLESILWLTVLSWVYVGELTFADSNVENSECIKDMRWVITGDIIEGKHGREEMQSALLMYLLSVCKWKVLLIKHEF